MTQESLQGNLEVRLRSQPSQVHNLIYVVCTEVSLRLEEPGRAPEGLTDVISRQVGLHTHQTEDSAWKRYWPRILQAPFSCWLSDGSQDGSQKAELSHRNGCLFQQFFKTSKNNRRYHTSHRNVSHFQARVSKVRGAGIEGFAWGWLRSCILSYKMKDFGHANEMVEERQKTDDEKIKVSTVSNFLMDKSSNTSRGD